MTYQKLTNFPSDLEIGARLIQQNALVAFPTETVYGIGALLSSTEGIENLFRFKGRNFNKPMTVHISSIDQITALIQEPPAIFYELVERFFPGPLTLIVKKAPRLPDQVTAGQEYVGIRMPDHSIANELIQLCGEPLVATSANLSGEPSPTNADEVIETFSDSLDAILDDGPTRYKLGSTVIKISEEGHLEVLRRGALCPTKLNTATF